jgi:5'-3' exonuclease
LRALLDGDIYAFRSASSAENDDLGIAIARMEEMIDNTLAETSSDQFSIFLSGENNFRYSIYPEYKANRNQPKPRHLLDCKQYLIDKYKAVVSDGCEADDLLGIEQCETMRLRGDLPGRAHNDVNPLASDTIICSIDKDLRMIPGNHYSFEISGKITRGPRAGETWVRPAERVSVTELEGTRKFYTQLLTGDSTDNVKGAAGIGPVKAERILADCTTEQEFVNAVRNYFSSDEELLMTGQCLWIFRKPNDRWQIPEFTS